MLYVSPTKDEIYGEYFVLDKADYFFDYNFLYGDIKKYKIGDIVISTLFGECIIANNPCRVNGEVIGNSLNINELLDRNIAYNNADVMVLYMRNIIDSEGNILDIDLIPSSTII